MTGPRPLGWLLAGPSLVTVHGCAERGGDIVAARTGFFLASNLIVLGMFSDYDSVKYVSVHDSQDQQISYEVLASDDTADLHLARVEIEDGPPGFLPAVTSPPNVGDMLQVLEPMVECTEFEFEGSRELPGWGTVLRIAFATDLLDGKLFANQEGELVGVHRIGVVDRKTEDARIPFDPASADGSPIVNEDGELVGIVRCRFVDHEPEEFGLPLSRLFSLIQRGLSSALLEREDLKAELGEKQNHVEELEAREAEALESLRDELTSTVHERDELKKKLAKQKKTVKGGVKLDHWGGEKIDHFPGS